MAYIHFTDEQKQQANSVDLVDFLQRQGEQLVRSGREWRWKRYDSVTVRGNQWFRHSRKEGGHAIDFVQQFYDMSFPEAVNYLLGEDCGVEWNQTVKSAPAPRKEFALPEANPDMRRVFAYLIKQRFIDREVLSRFAHEKLIYEDKEYHNAVFVGLDENGVPRHAHKRGTYTQGEPYKGNVEGSDPKYSFHRIGESCVLHVFEAPVDMLSFITLNRKDWQRHSYVTLDGVSEHAMLRQLELNPHLKSVALCMDYDEAGIEATGRLKDILSEKGYADISVRQSQYKDWNEDLKANNGVNPIPAQEHPKLTLLPKVVGELHDLCKALETNKDIDFFLRECAEAAEPFLASGKSAAENVDAVRECLQCMAAGSLIAMLRQLRQMELPMTTEQLLQKLQDSYHPHEDRGWLCTKAEQIRQDVSDISRQLHAPGIRTLADKEKLLSSYKRFALDSVKTIMFVEQELPSMLPAQEQAVNFSMTM
ncbi:DNA primase [bioreactor metagenome]|uniref:DNA primase n=1 Tax=bioreactor metagenome TaxID=1076179 RepID=A0A644WM78_9ZZZZ